jgi:hypothetical protein
LLKNHSFLSFFAHFSLKKMSTSSEDGSDVEEFLRFRRTRATATATAAATATATRGSGSGSGSGIGTVMEKLGKTETRLRSLLRTSEIYIKNARIL